ncbi:hypothetical protein [Streptomyces sp. NPDC057460]|uniref:hypothetical protein n=1 Tax=Streptomyces sp. NPDC057460 TaxID=3346141 RepID=UPI0036CA4DC9
MRDCTSGPGRVLLNRPAHGIGHAAPAPVDLCVQLPDTAAIVVQLDVEAHPSSTYVKDTQRTPASVAKPAQP